jgi:hypothetical protein
LSDVNCLPVLYATMRVTVWQIFSDFEISLGAVWQIVSLLNTLKGMFLLLAWQLIHLWYLHLPSSNLVYLRSASWLILSWGHNKYFVWKVAADYNVSEQLEELCFLEFLSDPKGGLASCSRFCSVCQPFIIYPIPFSLLLDSFKLPSLWTNYTTSSQFVLCSYCATNFSKLTWVEIMLYHQGLLHHNILVATTLLPFENCEVMQGCQSKTHMISINFQCKRVTLNSIKVRSVWKGKRCKSYM